MPRPSNPPFSSEAGAVVQPRTLQRWLDVNLIHKLTRNRGYFQIPVFSIETTWKGYSEIVAVFNYTSSKNFNLKAFTQPAAPNHIACVMWTDEDYNVYRYRLWEDAGEIFFFDVPLYTNQKIGKNFRIEIWNVEPDATSELLTFNLVGGGRAAVNQTYNKVSDTMWLGTDADAYVIELLTGVWTVYDLDPSPSPDYYTLTPTVNNPFPFGLWVTTAFGTANAPHAEAVTTCSNAVALSFYTSILGGYDYRYEDDYIIAAPSTVVENFSVALPADLPIEWPANSYPTLN